MTYEELVEKVAKSMSSDVEHSIGSDGYLLFEDDARAAVDTVYEALREPTDEMMLAARTAAGAYSIEFGDAEYKIIMDGHQIGGASDEYLAEGLMLALMEERMIRDAIAASPLVKKSEETAHD